MGLPFRLGTVAFIMAMMALALYILTAGILGRKIHAKSLALFFLCGEVFQWAAMMLYALYVFGTGDEDMPSAPFDTVCYLLMALVLGIIMTRLYRIPLLHTFTAAVLCTFVVSTANATMVDVVEEYSPLFDRMYFLAFVRLDVPYILTVGVALLVAAILKKSEFYRYFSALFRSRSRGILTLVVCLALLFIMPLQLGSEIAQMDGLNNIQLYPLRSLLATKLAKMRQLHIKGTLEALAPVRDGLAMDTDDLLRALGILLDNAIEAVPTGGGQVRVVLLQEEKELYLAVANNYEKAPDLTALTKKGYTTKGAGHGTGLGSYRRIVARCRGCAARTFLQDGMFVQELHIPTL